LSRWYYQDIHPLVQGRCPVTGTMVSGGEALWLRKIYYCKSHKWRRYSEKKQIRHVPFILRSWLLSFPFNCGWAGIPIVISDILNFNHRLLLVDKTWKSRLRISPRVLVQTSK
jgi:hypothetical protein